MTVTIPVEVVFAAPDAQSLRELRVPEGATAADAIEASKIQERFPAYQLSDLPIGVWGRAVSRDTVLRAGDRVEIYRQLEIDPMEARRIRASAPDPDPSESR